MTSSKVQVRRAARTLAVVSQNPSVAAIVGLTAWGPIAKALLCTSWPDYLEKFGGYTLDSQVAHAARGFFDNGGAQLWVVRTAHFLDPAQPETTAALPAIGHILSPGAPTPAQVTSASPGPYALQSGDEVVVSVDGGADVVGVFVATAAEVVAAGPGPYALTDGGTLLVRVDGGAVQPVVMSAADFIDIT